MEVLTDSRVNGAVVPLEWNHLGAGTKRIKLEIQEVVARDREA